MLVFEECAFFWWSTAVWVKINSQQLGGGVPKDLDLFTSVSPAWASPSSWSCDWARVSEARWVGRPAATPRSPPSPHRHKNPSMESGQRGHRCLEGWKDFLFFFFFKESWSGGTTFRTTWTKSFEFCGVRPRIWRVQASSEEAWATIRTVFPVWKRQRSANHIPWIPLAFRTVYGHSASAWERIPEYTDHSREEHEKATWDVLIVVLL